MYDFEKYEKLIKSRLSEYRYTQYECGKAGKGTCKDLLP